MTFQLFPSKKSLLELNAIDTQVQITFPYVTYRVAFCYELYFSYLYFSVGERESLQYLRI